MPHFTLQAMSTLNLKGLRELEELETGPLALSKAFQHRIHYIEEARVFSLMHEKKQVVMKVQKNTEQTLFFVILK